MFPTAFWKTSASDFSATSVANCRAWYRASLGVTNTAGAASAWADQSGAGDSSRNFSQGTSGSRPTITSANANFNNKATLDFDGTDDYMATGTFSSSYSPVTLYIVFRAASLGFLYVFDDLDGGSRVALLDSSGTFDLFAGAELTGGTYSTGTTYVLGMVCNGASSAIYANQYSTAAASGDAGANAFDSFTLGARYTVEGFFYGSVAELIAYSGAHDSTTRQTVMQGLGTLYGVTVTA